MFFGGKSMNEQEQEKLVEEKLIMFSRFLNKMEKTFEVYGFKICQTNTKYIDSLIKLVEETDTVFQIVFHGLWRSANAHFDDLSTNVIFKIIHKKNDAVINMIKHNWHLYEEVFEKNAKEITEYIQENIIPIVEICKDKSNPIESAHDYTKKNKRPSVESGTDPQEIAEETFKAFLDAQAKEYFCEVENSINETIKNKRFCFLCYINDEGYPGVMNIIPVKSDSIKSITFVSHGRFILASAFERCGKASVLFKSASPSLNDIELTGDIEIFTDRETRLEIWPLDFKNKFGEIHDSNYCVIKLTTKNFSIFNGLDSIYQTGDIKWI